MKMTAIQQARIELKGQQTCLLMLLMTALTRLAGDKNLPVFKTDFEGAVEQYLTGMEEQISSGQTPLPREFAKHFRQGIIDMRHQVILGFDGFHEEFPSTDT